MEAPDAPDEPLPPAVQAPGRGERIYVRTLWAVILITTGVLLYIGWLAWTMLG